MDDGVSSYYPILVLIILLFIEFIISAWNTALEHVSFAEDEEENDNHILINRIDYLRDQPFRFRRTYQSITAVITLILGVEYVPFVYALLPGSAGSGAAAKAVSLILAAIVLLVVFLWIGIFLPQKVAASRAETIAVRYSKAMLMLTYVFLPLRGISEALANVTARLTGIVPDSGTDDVTEQEIMSMVNEGHEQGAIREAEAEMIQNIFELDDTEAGDIMTIRKNISAIDSSMPLRDAMQYMLEESYSRFPVYQEDIDHIIGVIHIKDAMACIMNESDNDKAVGQMEGLIHHAIFVPETQSINVLFKTMQLQKNHLVIVVDEYGQTAGIVAMEDVLEEIVGNIEDEHDKEEKMIIRQPSGSYLISGMADLDDVEKELGIEVDQEDVDTLNGLLISLIDKIPEDRERFDITYQGYLFRVLSVKNKMIRMVSVTKQLQTDQEYNTDTKEN